MINKIKKIFNFINFGKVFFIRYFTCILRLLAKQLLKCKNFLKNLLKIVDFYLQTAYNSVST